MDEREKLRILLPHWISHNKEHAQEFRDWAHRVGEPLPGILAAADAVEHANEYLAQVLEELGGPAEAIFPE